VITLEKDMPIPPANGANARYPFGDMVVGDSFALPKQQANSVRSAASQFGKRNDMRFAVRVQGEQVRVWRTA